MKGARGEKIKVGALTLEVRPLKLGQLRHLLDALQTMAGKSGGALIETGAGVIVAGVAPAHPDVTADMILDQESSLDQFNEAVATVLRVAGLRQNAGEAEPQPEQAWAASTAL